MPNEIWPHLPSSAQQQPKQAQAKPSLAETMWPRLSERAKAKDKLREQERQKMLKDLRELREGLAKVRRR